MCKTKIIILTINIIYKLKVNLLHKSVIKFNKQIYKIILHEYILNNNLCSNNHHTSLKLLI